MLSSFLRCFACTSLYVFHILAMKLAGKQNKDEVRGLRRLEEELDSPVELIDVLLLHGVHLLETRFLAPLDINRAPNYSSQRKRGDDWVRFIPG